MLLLRLAPLLLVDPPQNRQTEVTVRAKRQLDDDAEHHPVVAEAKDLVLLGAEYGIKEDAAEGHFGPSLVSERIIDDDPEADARHQGQHSEQEQTADFIPVPDGLAEQAIDTGMAALLGLAGGLPDPADGAATQTNDP